VTNNSISVSGASLGVGNVVRSPYASLVYQELDGGLVRANKIEGESRYAVRIGALPTTAATGTAGNRFEGNPTLHHTASEVSFLLTASTHDNVVVGIGAQTTILDEGVGNSIAGFPR